MAAAAKVFAKKGFHGAAVDDVADAAGLTKGAVYSNFRTKEKLFLSLLEEQSSTHHDAIQTILDSHSEATPRRNAVVDYMVNAVTDRTWSVLGMEFVLYSSRNPALRRALADRERAARAATLELLRQDWSDNGVTPIISEDEAVKLVDALVAGIAIKRLVDPTEYSRESVANLVRFQLSAIVGPSDESSPHRST